MPSVGTTNVVILGEAPGLDEDKAGKGFVGKAGKDVLWPTLKAHGLIRRMFHVTNVCKCYPGRRIKTPQAKHIKACMPWLIEELSNIECRLCLAFGNTGLRALTDRKSGIIEANGTTEWIEDLGLWVCWCVHPASVLYDRSNYDLFEVGIKNFAEKVK